MIKREDCGLLGKLVPGNATETEALELINEKLARLADLELEALADAEYRRLNGIPDKKHPMPTKSLKEQIAQADKKEQQELYNFLYDLGCRKY